MRLRGNRLNLEIRLASVRCALYKTFAQEMNLPGRIAITVKRSDGTPVEGVIATMTVKSGTKNRYHIDFPQTNEAGHSTISEAEFRGQYEDHWEQGLMDYNGTIEDAAPSITVSLFDTNRLRENRRLAEAWPLLKNEIGKWADRTQKIGYYIDRVHI